MQLSTRPSPRLPTISLLALCLAAAVMASCVAPARVTDAHLDDFLSAHRIKLPDELYSHVAAHVKRRRDAYDGQYVPAGVDKYGNRVELKAELKPGDPGEILTVKTKDPGFRDRSLARVLMNWTPYLDRDFRRERSGEYPDPVTYYRAYTRWKSSPNPRPEDEPAPRVFMFLPSHFMIQAGGGAQDCDTQSLGGVVNLMLRVDAIADSEARLAATHALISWLKGDPVKQVGPCPVAPVINDHTTGMGLFFVPIMMFPDATGAYHPNLKCPAPAAGQTLPPPCLQVAVADLLIKFTAVKTAYPPGLFDARFAPGLGGEAYRAFFEGCPSGAMYESLAHTDDTVVLANEGLEPDAALRENVRRDGRTRTSDAIFRSLTLSSVISAERDEYGRPLVNGRVQHPPSGVPLEEASYFLHASMVHAADGYGAALWSSSPHMMSALALNYAGLRAAARQQSHGGQHRPPEVGVREQWNENYKDLQGACGQTAELPVALTPHMEIYDSHIYLPHGDLAKLTERYHQITITEGEDPGGLETPEQWAAVGYVASSSEGETPRLLTFSECRAKGLSEEQCSGLFASVFSAPYCGPLSRLRTSMSPEHCALTDAAGLPSPDDPVTRIFHENISETVKDTLECRETVDTVILDCAGCRFEDATPLPALPNGKPSVLGEQLAFLWIHLWPYGSMYTLHDGDAQFPRYWSTDGDNGGALAGLMSFKRYHAGGDSFPDASLHDAAWFTEDVHGYFGAPVDRAQLRRPGRGDPMYLLRHLPKSLLKTGSNLPDPSFPREANACGCGE